MWHLVYIYHSPELEHREAWARKYFPLLSSAWVAIWARRWGEKGPGQPTSARSHTFLPSHFDVLYLWSKSFHIGYPSSLPISLLALAMYHRERSPLIISSLRESEPRHRRKKQRHLNLLHLYVSYNMCR